MQEKKKPAKKSIVIVESPAKSKTINKILGDTYIVTSCMGHVRDLPQRPRGGNLGVDLNNDFNPTYKILNKKKDVVKELRLLTDEAKDVYLATDPDREGEAIAWHLVSALKLIPRKTKRVTFNEITPTAILKAFEKPGRIAMDLVNAQQARRILDRIVGYRLSPLLWDKIAKKLSAGRVQSVGLKIIVEREREIKAFKSEEYWRIKAIFTKDGKEFEAELVKIGDQQAKIQNQAQADSILKKLQGGKFIVSKITQKERIERPYPPFITSLMQQRASTELGYGAKRTMMIAQLLYQGVEVTGEGPVGLITYMRTDSFRIANDALKSVREFIKTEFGDKYVPESPNIYKSKSKSAQEAHEAIRPTYVNKAPESIKKDLSDEQYKLYKLIWSRFVACQMKEAVYFTTDVAIKCKDYIFQAKGRKLKFDGFTRVLPTKSEDQVLPAMEDGETLELKDLKPTQHFTEPPPRYTEASLIKTLEKFGIGRPSTYAPTVTTIQERGYVRLEDRKLIPTELGILVNGKLEDHFKNYINTDFTAKMEEGLDLIEQGKVDWVRFLRGFYDDFAREFDQAKDKMSSEKETASERCEKCSSEMIITWTKYGKVIRCTNENCKHKKVSSEYQIPGQNCEKCGTPLVIKFSRRGRFLACPRFPECSFTKSILKGDKIVKVPDTFQDKCEKCQSPLALRHARRGPFLGCTGYPNCKNAKPIPKEWLVDLYPKKETTTKEEAEEPIE